MRNDQPDPADNAADGHRRSGDQRRQENHHDPQAPGLDTQDARLLVAHGKKIDAPAQGSSRIAATAQRRQRRQPCPPSNRGQRAEQPELDDRQFRIGVGDVFEQRQERGEQRTDDDAAQHQDDGRVQPGKAGSWQSRSQPPAARRRKRRTASHNAAEKQDGHGRAEAGAGRKPSVNGETSGLRNTP